MPPQYDHDHENEVVPFAQTNFRGRTQRFGIKTDDRRRHMYLIGKTGMGKTSMLEQLAYHDIVAGHGVAYLDPHGDTAHKLLDFIPAKRINDVIYFNPADLDWPIAFNVLEQVEGNQKHLVASGLLGIFKKIWADSWGPRLEYVLRNAILALMDYPGTTLLGIMRILVDKEYRRKVIAKVSDPVVKSFWIDEYARYPDKFQTEAIAPIQNKVGQFLSSPLIRNIVGQVKSTVNIREIMDERKILIMNLAKGGVGEDNSALLGAMMVTKIYLGAMERVNIPENERQDFYLYVDEFQNFATDSFANILSEARKYRLNLVIAHQYVGQLMTDTSTRVRDAVFGNVGTLTSFRVGAQDAEFLEPEFMPTFTQEDLVNLPKWSVYLKLMINGVASQPFSAGTLPPVEAAHEREGNEAKVIAQTHERYTCPREEIENKIARWTGMLPSEGEDDEDEGTTQEGEWQAARAHAKEIVRDIPKREEGSPGGWFREAARTSGGSQRSSEDGGGASGGPRREPMTVECAQCGGGATVYFKPRPGQRVLCENCMRAEKERKKMEELTGQPPRGAPRSERGPSRPAGPGSSRMPRSGMGTGQDRGRSGPPNRGPGGPGRGPDRGPRPGPPRDRRPPARPTSPSPPPINTLAPMERKSSGEVSLSAMISKDGETDARPLRGEQGGAPPAAPRPPEPPAPRPLPPVDSPAQSPSQPPAP